MAQGIGALFGWFTTYTRWLHTRWPAGTVERLPEVKEDGTTAVPGVRVVGDLTGIPLLKFAVDSGAKAVKAISAEPDFQKGKEGILDVAIVGAGVAGISAAIEAKAQGLKFAVFEAASPFSTVVNFPKGKPIYTYPTEFEPAGGFKVSAPVKEELVTEMERQREAAGIDVINRRVDRVVRKGDQLQLVFAGKEEPVAAQRVIIAIGRSGNFRKLGCPGEDLPKVYNRLFDPKEFHGKNVVVVGGGDSALEAAIALATCGANVTLSYRKPEFSRPKPENIEKIKELQANPAAHVSVEKPVSERVTTAAGYRMRGDKPPGSLRLALATKVKAVTEDSVTLAAADGGEEVVPNDVVFAMIGRDAPLDFFRRSGIPIHGEWRTGTWTSFLLFFAFCWFIYIWKGGTATNKYFKEHRLFPFNVPDWLQSLGGWIAEQAANSKTFLGVLSDAASAPGFYYSLAYTALVFGFGIRRMQRRKTPYVRLQTWTLIAVQSIPLFFLPYFLLPLMGNNGWFDSGALKWVADQLFPMSGSSREYWRAFGLILAWPLFIWNVFTDQPLWGWLIISFVQTFVLIPLIIYRWGKGAYCGWICSCGALAETLGDAHRHKMPHGPVWNRLNMTGQVILWVAFAILAIRIVLWTTPTNWKLNEIYYQIFYSGSIFGLKLNYYYLVDIFLAGIIGVGLYFWFSGRVWCRFACPLAALMHIYARFSKFRIFANKSKCISCNVCTSVCHQGIDIMNFANKGMPMEDPECVRCSACVQSCPTGVLKFGRYGKEDEIIYDKIAASPVLMREEANRNAEPKLATGLPAIPVAQPQRDREIAD